MNICGVLVQAEPSRQAEVLAALGQIAGVEVHAAGEGGRIVVTAEDTDGSPALNALERIHRLGGVIAASLVYHHFEPLDLEPDRF